MNTKKEKKKRLFPQYSGQQAVFLQGVTKNVERYKAYDGLG